MTSTYHKLHHTTNPSQISILIDLIICTKWASSLHIYWQPSWATKYIRHLRKHLLWQASTRCLSSFEDKTTHCLRHISVSHTCLQDFSSQFRSASGIPSTSVSISHSKPLPAYPTLHCIHNQYIIGVCGLRLHTTHSNPLRSKMCNKWTGWPFLRIQLSICWCREDH